MRKYLQPAMRYAYKAILQPSAVRAFMIRRRTFAIPLVVSLLAVTAMGMMAVQGLTKDEIQPNAVTHKKHVEGNSITTTVTTENVPQISNSPVGDTSDVTANVTVNGQTVTVPQGDSYSKTIKNDNGTTHINVSNNSSSSGGSFSSSVSSTHFNISSNNYTNDIKMHSP